MKSLSFSVITDNNTLMNCSMRKPLFTLPKFPFNYMLIQVSYLESLGCEISFLMLEPDSVSINQHGSEKEIRFLLENQSISIKHIIWEEKINIFQFTHITFIPCLEDENVSSTCFTHSH